MTNREEIAEKPRVGGIARNVQEAYVVLLSCIGVRPQLPAENTYMLALERLANLIDPTCHMRETVEDGKTMYVCSNCYSCKSDDKKAIQQVQLLSRLRCKGGA